MGKQSSKLSVSCSVVGSGSCKNMFACYSPGGAAAHGVLQPGDRLIVVNDKDFGNLSHFVAWNFLKSVPEGTIKMTIGRKVDP